MIPESAQPAYVAQAIRLRLLHESGGNDMLLHQVFRVRGPLDAERLAVAVHRLVKRRDSLRSGFELRNGRGWQRFLPPGSGPALQTREFDAETAAKAWFRDEISAPFDLLSGPVARFGLARLRDDEHLFCVACTHNVTDGYSMNLIMADLEALYAGTVPGEAPTFAAWARRRARHLAEVEQEARAFWAREFPGPPPGAALPPPLPDPPGSIVAPNLHIGAETVRALRRLAAAHEVSLYIVLLAAVHQVRAREQEVDELTYTVNVANRDDAAAESTVGCLTHRVLVRVRDRGAGVHALLQHIRETLLAVLGQSAVPFRVVRSWLAEWHGTQTPESQLTYVVLGPEWGGGLRLPGTEVERIAPEDPDPGSDGLEFWFTEGETGITLKLRYPPAHYSATSAANLSDEVGEVLDRMVRTAVAP